MIKILKIFGIVAVCIVVLIFAGGFLFSQNCLGRMQACYATWRSWHHPPSQAEALKPLMSQFTASPATIAFSVGLDNNETGLLFIDRDSRQLKLLHEKGFGFWWPHLSPDGKRFIAIRRRNDTANREIISCLIKTWHC
jgi:hypothetical protein